MPSEPTNRPPSPPQLPPGMAVVQYDLLTLRYRIVLGYLFVHPKLALSLLCIRPFLLKSMLTLLALCVAGGLAMARFCSRIDAADIRGGLEFLHETVGDIELAGGRLAWQEPTPSPLPASKDLGRFRLTVTGGPERPEAADAGIPKAGLVISPSRVWFWSRGGEAGGQTVWQELPTLRHLRDFNGKGQFRLTRESLPDYVSALGAAAFLAQWLVEAASLVAQWLVWCVMMMVLSLFGGLAAGVLRRPGRPPLRHRLAVACSLSANLTLVPLLASLIYSVAGFGTPSSLVGVMFLVYLIYAAIEGYRSHLGFFSGNPPNQQ